MELIDYGKWAIVVFFKNDKEIFVRKFCNVPREISKDDILKSDEITVDSNKTYPRGFSLISAYKYENFWSYRPGQMNLNSIITEDILEQYLIKDIEKILNENI